MSHNHKHPKKQDEEQRKKIDADLLACFRQLDADDNGRIDSEELTTAFKLLGNIDIKKAECAKLISSHVADMSDRISYRDNSLNYEQFYSLMSDCLKADSEQTGEIAVKTVADFSTLKRKCLLQAVMDFDAQNTNKIAMWREEPLAGLEEERPHASKLTPEERSVLTQQQHLLEGPPNRLLLQSQTNRHIDHLVHIETRTHPLGAINPDDSSTSKPPRPSASTDAGSTSSESTPRRAVDEGARPESTLQRPLRQSTASSSSRPSALRTHGPAFILPSQESEKLKPKIRDIKKEYAEVLDFNELADDQSSEEGLDDDEGGLNSHLARHLEKVGENLLSGMAGSSMSSYVDSTSEEEGVLAASMWAPYTLARQGKEAAGSSGRPRSSVAEVGSEASGEGKLMSSGLRRSRAQNLAAAAAATPPSYTFIPPSPPLQELPPPKSSKLKILPSPKMPPRPVPMQPLGPDSAQKSAEGSALVPDFRSSAPARAPSPSGPMRPLVATPPVIGPHRFSHIPDIDKSSAGAPHHTGSPGLLRKERSEPILPRGMAPFTPSPLAWLASPSAKAWSRPFSPKGLTPTPTKAHGMAAVPLEQRYLYMPTRTPPSPPHDHCYSSTKLKKQRQVAMDTASSRQQLRVQVKTDLKLAQIQMPVSQKQTNIG